MKKEALLHNFNRNYLKLLLILILVLLIVEGVVIYNWQHNKVTSLQGQVKTLNAQLQYVQGEQNKLERQIK